MQDCGVLEDAFSSSSHNLCSSTGKYSSVNSTNTMPIKKNQDVAERAEEETRPCTKRKQAKQEVGVLLERTRRSRLRNLE
jgi:hypothetical protein